MTKEVDVSFENSYDKVLLSGTFSIPKKGNEYPAVILISGSGPQTRDQDIFGHKLFKDIAQYLVDRGIGVLRFDVRGVGESGGDFNSAGLIDFKRDIISGFHFLKHHKGVKEQRIGMLGHSLGALLAAMAANEIKGGPAFIISLAGPGLNGRHVFIKQHQLISKMRGVSEEGVAELTRFNQELCDLVIDAEDRDELLVKIKRLMLSKHYSSFLLKRYWERIKLYFLFLLQKELFDTYTQRWFKEYLLIEPCAYWLNVKCPVLAISGSKDLQVPEENLKAIEGYLKQGSNQDYEVRIYGQLNHLFQLADKGLPEEYPSIKHSISEDVLHFISSWILSRD